VFHISLAWYACHNLVEIADNLKLFLSKRERKTAMSDI